MSEPTPNEEFDSNESMNKNDTSQTNDESERHLDKTADDSLEKSSETENETTESVEQPPKLNSDEAFCSSCGQKIKEKAEICPHCGVRQQGSQGQGANVGRGSGEQNPGLAALASVFIPGAGQVYNDQLWKGIGLMIAYGVSIPLTVVLIGFVTIPVIWIYAVYDAHKTAKKINAGEVI
jgi:TM2 domain-containing membrane protein YozV